MISVSLVLSCLIATTLMTAFSYLLSTLSGKQFREPELLNTLLSRVIRRTLSPNHFAGWLMHYGVGLLFVASYYFLFRRSHPSWFHYALAGFISGIVGVIIWFVTFRFHPAPPTLDRKKFYIQLIPAHIVFGIGAYIINYCL